MVALVVVGGCMDAFTGRGKSPCAGEQSFQITTPTPDDPALQFQIEQCRVDADACTALCALTMQRNSLNGVQTGCHVAFHGDTQVQVDLKWGCEVQGADDEAGSGCGK